MTVISKNSKTNKIFYNSESTIGKQTLGYLNGSFKSLLSIDVTKTKVTGTQWKELAEGLNMSLEDLTDKNHPEFKKHYDKHLSLDETDWIKVLNAHPEVLKNPIIILGEKYYKIENPSDVEKLLEPNSKGIDEKKHI